MRQVKKHDRWRVAIWMFLVIHTLIVVGFWMWKLTVRHALDCGELEVLNAVYWWRRGIAPPYPRIDQIPTFANHYGPVYEALCAFLPSFGHPYFIGRVISLLATVTLLFAVALWVFCWTRNWTCGWFAALFLLTAKPIFSFGILHRVDMSAVMLSALGFVLVLLTRHWLPAVIGVILMGIGFHTKLTAIAAPIACIIALWNKERPRALLVGTVWLVLAISGVVAMQLITNGNYLYHAILGNEPSQWLKPLDMLTRPLTSSPFWVALAFYIWRLAKTEKIEAFKPELSYRCLAHCWHNRDKSRIIMELPA